MTAPIVRPMREEDLEAFAEITATSYHGTALRTAQRDWPDPVRRPPARNGHWIRRTGQALVTDPGGCWVAEVDGEVVGGAVSRVRELMWILASFAVKPGHQGQGIGAQLMAAAMHHGRGCLRGMFAASADPAAVRRASAVAVMTRALAPTVAGSPVRSSGIGSWKLIPASVLGVQERGRARSCW